MKTLSISTFMFLLLCNTFYANAKCYRNNDFYVGSIVYYSDNPSFVHNIDTSFVSDETFSFVIRYVYEEYGTTCMASITSWSWRKNGFPVSSAQTYTVTDTGVYEGYFQVEHTDFMSTWYSSKYVRLHVAYSNITSVNTNAYLSKELFIYPQLSTGIFNVKSESPLSTFIITDNAGRTVFSSQSDISEIDLSAKAAGVYFYYAEDKANRRYRGKLVKE